MVTKTTVLMYHSDAFVRRMPVRFYINDWSQSGRRIPKGPGRVGYETSVQLHLLGLLGKCSILMTHVSFCRWTQVKAAFFEKISLSATGFYRLV